MLSAIHLSESMRIQIYVVLAGYMVCLIFTSYLFHKFNKSFTDYFRGGWKGTWWLAGTSSFMAAFSAWTFTAAAGLAYEGGVTVIVIFISGAIGFFVNFLFTASWFRQLRITTSPEAVEMRFGPASQQFVAWSGTIFGFVFRGLWLYGVSIFCYAVFGYNLILTIVVLSLVVLVYVTIGGIWGVMATNLLQTLIVLPITILVAFLSLRHIGGLGEMINQYQQQGLTDSLHVIDSKHTLPWIIAFFLKNIMLYNSVDTAGKYAPVKNGHDARKAALLTSVLLVLGTCIWFIPPMVARLVYPNIDSLVPGLQKPAEAAYALISVELLPPALVGLLIAAVFAATLSTMSVNLNQSAAVITQDLYKPLIRKNASDRELLVVGHIATIILGFGSMGMAIIYALQEGVGAFEIMIQAGALIAIPLAIPLFLCLFIKKLPSWCLFFSAAIGFSFSLIGFFLDWNFQTNVYVLTSVTTSAVLLSMIWGRKLKPAYREKVDRFFELMHKPVDFDKEVGLPNDYSQFIILGRALLIFGTAVTLLTILTHTLFDVLCVLFVSSIILFFGILFLFLGKRNRPVNRTLNHSDGDAR